MVRRYGLRLRSTTTRLILTQYTMCSKMCFNLRTFLFVVQSQRSLNPRADSTKIAAIKIFNRLIIESNNKSLNGDFHVRCSVVSCNIFFSPSDVRASGYPMKRPRVADNKHAHMAPCASQSIIASIDFHYLYYRTHYVFRIAPE